MFGPEHARILARHGMSKEDVRQDLHRRMRDRFRAEPILVDRLMEKTDGKGVDVRWNYVVEEVLGDDDGVTGLRLRNVVDGAAQDLGVDGVFIAIGHRPNTSLFGLYVACTRARDRLYVSGVDPASEFFGDMQG